MSSSVVGGDHAEIAQDLFVVMSKNEAIDILFTPEVVLPIRVDATYVLDILLHCIRELVGRLAEEDLMYALGDRRIFIGDVRQ